MTTEFSKYEGAGNDFIVIDNRKGLVEASCELIAALCDRRFGVGADGLMLYEDDPSADFRMRYFNSDGLEATMCGNGGRCIALFACHLMADCCLETAETADGLHSGVDNCQPTPLEVTFTAPDGVHCAKVSDVAGEMATVSLWMNDVAGIATIGRGSALDTGSPHFVELVDDVDNIDVAVAGKNIRWLREFEPQGGTNVDFVQIMNDNSIKIRTFERGVEAETLACGTGAVAGAIIASRKMGRGGNLNIHTRGGMLKVSFDEEKNGIYSNIRLTGPARRVFRGIFEMKNFMS